jgi:HSP20 family protein
MEYGLWEEFAAMERRMDDLFRTFMRPRVHTRLIIQPTGFHQPFLPAADVFARDGNLAIRMELPGIDPAKDVSVTLEGHDLVVRGERRRHEEVKDEDILRMETAYGAFERRIPLPDGVVEKDINAEYKDGVLEIMVPGAARALEPVKPEPKAIPIKAAKKAAA